MRDMLKVDGDPAIDMMLVSAHQVDTGMLRHLDVLIFAHDIYAACKKHAAGKFIQSQLKAFLERGGKIIVSGNGAECVPPHSGVIEVPVGADLAEAALKTR